MEQEFFVALGPQERRFGDGQDPITAVDRRSRYFIDDPVMLFRRAHHAAFADFAFADFELRLDQRNDSPFWGNKRMSYSGKINLSEINEASMVAIAGMNGRRARLEITNIGFFENHDARVVAQFPIELAITDIHRDDLARRRERANNR